MPIQSIAPTAPAWTIPGYLETSEGHLTISGVDALSLVAEHDTPLFVFSEPRIRSNILRLKRAARQSSGPSVSFTPRRPIQTWPCLKTVLEAGIDAEVNSGGELFKALRAGFRPEQIIFNGTSKTDAELDAAVSAGIYAINVDSIYEIELVEEAARRLGRRARIALGSCRRSAHALI